MYKITILDDPELKIIKRIREEPCSLQPSAMGIGMDKLWEKLKV